MKGLLSIYEQYVSNAIANIYYNGESNYKNTDTKKSSFKPSNNKIDIDYKTYEQYLLKEDRDACLEIVKRDGLKLKEASVLFQNDKEIVLSAFTNDARSIKYAGSLLTNDKGFMLEVNSIKSALQFDRVQADTAAKCLLDLIMYRIPISVLVKKNNNGELPSENPLDLTEKQKKIFIKTLSDSIWDYVSKSRILGMSGMSAFSISLGDAAVVHALLEANINVNVADIVRAGVAMIQKNSISSKRLRGKVTFYNINDFGDCELYEIPKLNNKSKAPNNKKF